MAVGILEMDCSAWHTAHAAGTGRTQDPIDRVSHEHTMRAIAGIGCLVILTTLMYTTAPASPGDEIIAFAVVREQPRDPSRIAARVSVDSTASDVDLLVSEDILSNPIWKSLEICHALKLEGRPVPEGFHVASVRVIDSAMLPMVLQGFAGDCLLKKALEIAPFMD
ncbi:MAG: hypothetical protein OEY86_00315 [Nitrospira sp.]|nr:hypothetical protein [Nitrospira sp.]